ncbi:MAG: ABC transporter ATP-binding protein [Flavobacterium nitrogenifigens]|uniref:ABC transporter ATP-binding protein n=1 Tax=Flavobacterium nitrogenifigens TaxID=1617283 RepID=UPI002808E857|nr:ABC transporter ATP-binding protein [Flavobacterium nitrogenifigens]MDQ8013209.1 ABC transporter ATP-binding protein [Flavobacterium nitrogenifigens]
MIRVEKLSKTYGSSIVLDNVNFLIEKGEIAVIYGRNGAGKTTLIKCLSGLVKPDCGSISLAPDNKKKIGLYLGHEMLIGKLKVKEYLFLAGKLHGLSNAEIESKTSALAQSLDFGQHLDKMASKISFGTKSKVLFAASVINDPEILIMDEPFIGLDLIAIKEVVRVLSDLRKKGCTLFISSNQVDILENFTDKILILKNQTIALERKANIPNSENNGQLSDFILAHLK